MAKSHYRKTQYPDEALQDDRPAKSRKRRADEDEPSRNDHIVNRPPTKSRKRHCDDEPSRNHSPASQPRIGETSQDDPRDDPSAKRIKPAVEHHDPWVYPPEFWDRLSKIPLIHEAVAELDRRTSARSSSPRPPPLSLPSTGPVQDLALAPAKELARFARHGGPSLGDLRGYPMIKNSDLPADAMSSSSHSGNTKSTSPASSRATKITDPTTKTKTSISPYNRAFEQHLTDYQIHPTWKSSEPNLEGIRPALAVPRGSLSPSRFSDGAFKTFQRDNAQAKDEEDVRAYVVPTILGPRQIDHPSAMSTLFGNLDPLTDGTLAPAKPDVYYGANPEQLNRPIRDKLRGYIIPSTMEDKPMAPNFFLEVKGPDGSAAVATRQARYDGALGARAMHSLQNYGSDKPVLDGNAYTFSSTYHDGMLKLYAHHPTAPATPGERPEYHMTQLEAYAMTGSRKTFVEGATAFRNARDLADRYRQKFIAAANAKTKRSREELVDTTVQQDDGSSTEEYEDCEEYPIQSSQGINKASALPHYLEDDQDESQSSVPDEVETPAASFTTSFTSSFNSGNDTHRHRTHSRRIGLLRIYRPPIRKNTITRAGARTARQLARERARLVGRRVRQDLESK
ncbi:hypothetical protein RRF57_009161 [Xylaria bambusicola]|uniref:DUF7924 domain-containing protein n=1 Tax=Xylaria bambusicola TaxID=326684 RepID=A0AAN7UQH8_9PEZI